ncbi:MAG: HlyD family efflux transporter periplasmic adaptor subunit [Myxococcales bacterium]|nr:HlyD family efflux transporter periplasmic adaptor subunit [Myxococcales bacterium]
MSSMNLTMRSQDPAEIAAESARALAPSPPFARTFAWFLVVFFLAVAGALVLLPWQQTAVGQGRVVAYAPLERQQPIEAPIEGRIARVFVREGSHVRAGETLLEMTDNDPQIMERLRQERDALRARLEAARTRAQAVDDRGRELAHSRDNAISAADNRVRMARNRAQAASQALAASEAAAETSRLNYERQLGLVREGLVSTRVVELATLDQLRTRVEVDRSRASLEAARAEVEAVSSDRDRVSTDGLAQLNDVRATRASVDAEIASATAELTRLEVRLARQSTMTVTAPRDGTVLRITANPGSEVVKAGDSLMVFVPDTEARAVELWVDGNDVPLLREGRHVRIQFEGWPAIQFSGWPAASIGTFGGKVVVIDAADNGRGQFRVVVVPAPGERWPSGRYLRQGVRANGWILLNRVKLGFELWRQFNGFPPTVNPADASAYGTPSTYSGGSGGGGGSYGGGGGAK